MTKLLGGLLIAASLLIAGAALAEDPYNTVNPEANVTVTQERDAYAYFIDAEHKAPNNAEPHPSGTFNDWTTDDDPAVASYDFTLSGDIAHNGKKGEDTEFVAFGADCTGVKITFALTDVVDALGNELGTDDPTIANEEDRDGKGIFKIWVDGQITAVPAGFWLAPGTSTEVGKHTVGIGTPNVDRVSAVKIELSGVGVEAQSGSYDGILSLELSGI